MLAKLIRRIAEALDQAKIPYMIIGGQAVLLYGRPRLTRDEDVRHLLAKNREQLDFTYLGRWLSEFSALPEQEQIVESFERLLEE